jgi:TonB family protein
MLWRTFICGLLLAVLFAGPAYSKDQGAPPATSSAPADQSGQAAPVAHPARIRVGGSVQQANLIHMVQPVYPPDATLAHISGTVTIHIVVGRDGTVQTLDVVSGPDVLKQAAVDAVKQWRYRPTLLNGEPVEVDTKVQVVFDLSRSPQAADETGPASDAIDPQFKADILHLLDLMGVREKTSKMGATMFASVRPAILASLPATANREKIADAYVEKLTRLFSSPELIDRIAVIYANHFTDDDVKALADFFQTPAGRHFNDAGAQLFSAGFDAGQAMAREHVPDILRSLCEEYPELQGEAKFCPDENKEKKGQLMSPDEMPLDARASLRPNF